MDWYEALNTYGQVLRQLRSDRQKIEEACEQALQEGEHGVFVLWDEGGRLRMASPHSYVPYGKIYEARMPLSVDFWSLLSDQRAS